MRCPSCHLIIDPRTAWKNSTDRFYCSEFCADSEISAPVQRRVQKEAHDREYLERPAAAFASCAGLQIQSSNSTIRRRTPMTTIVAVRGLFSAAEKINEASRSLCCDHCRRELRFPVHRYWRMRFCSAACANAYQQRLSPRTQQKIYEIDGYRPSWKAAS